MLFSSIVFLFYFFPAVFLLYYLLSFSRRLQNLLLLIASLFFYAWGEPVYVLIMLSSIAFNSLAGFVIAGIRRPGLKKAFLVLCVAANVAVLFVFK